MLPALRRELVEHRSRQAAPSLALVRADALVFTTARGKPQSRRNALRAVHVAGDAAGLNGDGRRAGRAARPAPLARRDRVRARPDRPRGRRARAARERERHAHRLRRPDRRTVASARRRSSPTAGSVRENPWPLWPQRAFVRVRSQRTARSRSARLLGFPNLSEQARTPQPFRQAGGHWFEPSTAHRDPRSRALARMAPWVAFVSGASVAQAVHPLVLPDRTSLAIRSQRPTLNPYLPCRPGLPTRACMRHPWL